ncbi:MAG: hypothetical protein R6W96_02400 [Clostridia bacterium]
MNPSFLFLMKKIKCIPYFTLTGFHDANPVSLNRFVMDFDEEGAAYIQTRDSLWRIIATALPVRRDAFSLTFDFELVKGLETQASLGVGFLFENWDEANDVLMPAAAYKGNRFHSFRSKYPPQLDEKHLYKEIPVMVSDVPRLNIHPGPSRIQQLTRDMSTPGAGFFSPGSGLGFFLLTPQETVLGDSMVSIEENPARSEAFLELSAPGVRHGTCYRICDNAVPSPDRGADFKSGDAFQLQANVYVFPCHRPQDLFDYFTGIRKDFAGVSRPVHSLPFSGCYKIQEKKFNAQNWVEEYGYYSVAMRESIYADWQVGWVGGLMVTHPLLFEGDNETRNRAIRNINFVFNGGQSPSGLFHGCFHRGKWYGDSFRDVDEPWHLVRKSADALYFLMKQYDLLVKLHGGFVFPESWMLGTRRLADAFVRLYERYGEFGQYADTLTGELIVRGSASAGIVMAGLALCADFLDEPSYLDLARESALQYHRRFVEKGFTTGGPGEILQCPDSESAFGFLESLVVLYETTGEEQWLAMAKDQANQCFTWCVSYDFRFPSSSTFGKLDMKTRGTVYASVQNKHSAPGICTLSGDSLFKLYRYTGDIRYLDLIRDISHSLPQYLSREDRPISGMPPGWMNERVEMSDWNEPVGEIFYGSCWSEVSTMLTHVEIPGIYVQPDTGLLWVMDHVNARVLEKTGAGLLLEVCNPTAFDAEVKIMAEPSQQMGSIMGQNSLFSCMRVPVKSGDTVTIPIEVPEESLYT